MTTRDMQQIEEAVVVEQVRPDKPMNVSNERVTNKQSTAVFNPIQAMIQRVKNGYVPEEGVYYCPRLDIEYELRTIPEPEYNVLVKRASKWLQIGGTFQETMDNAKFQRLLIAECSWVKIDGKLIPAFSNGEMVQAFGSPENAVSSVFFPGEATKCAGMIMRMHKFEAEVVEQEATVVRIKNS